jgi:hypothetical protein
MELTTHLKEVLNHFKDKRIRQNITSLVQKIIEHQSIQLWAIADDKAEFERYRNVLNGRLESVLDDEKITAALRQAGVAALGGKPRLILLHDPCDIRKEHAKAMEKLGQVRDLDGKLVSGYSTFNTVAVTPDRKRLRLLDLTVYSNGDERFVGQAELTAWQKGKVAANDPQRAEEIAQYVAEDSYLNLRRITHHQLRRVHEALKGEQPDIQLCHVLDRQFDGEPTFTFIDQGLGDEFIIRLKVSRNAPAALTDEDEVEKEVAGKLVSASLPCHHRRILDKIVIKKKVYQQACCRLEWGNITLGDAAYTLVRITLLSREGKPLYKQPLLLLTNLPVPDATQAQAIYATYLMRAKIETVFKFLKDSLGWEQFQVQDFESITNLIALCFFVGQYFFELEPALTDHHPVIALIAQLGGGKGKVTRHYFLEGLRTLLIYQSVAQFLDHNQIEADLFEDMLHFVR